MTESNPSSTPTREPKDLPPLKPDVFLILAILAEGDRHGYAIMQDAENWPGGGMEIQAGALYRRLKWMTEEGLIQEVDSESPPPQPAERRRVYRVTPFGRQVAVEEALRMEGLLAAAREAALVPGGEGI